MAKILGQEKKASAMPAERVREELPKDPIDSGFRRMTGCDTSLDYEASVGSSTFRVHCEISEADGRRWLALRIDKFPGPTGFRDISFIRRVFFGPDIPAMIHYGPDLAATPAGESKVILWMPLDEAILPSGHYKREKA